MGDRLYLSTPGRGQQQREGERRIKSLKTGHARVILLRRFMGTTYSKSLNHMHVRAAMTGADTSTSRIVRVE